jgi:hypothetical protein
MNVQAFKAPSCSFLLWSFTLKYIKILLGSNLLSFLIRRRLQSIQMMQEDYPTNQEILKYIQMKLIEAREL